MSHSLPPLWPASHPIVSVLIVHSGLRTEFSKPVGIALPVTSQEVFFSTQPVNNWRMPD